MAHNGAVPSPVHVAFLGCGFITGVHSRHLRRLRGLVAASYASRDGGKADAFRTRYGGVGSYGAYGDAIADPGVDAVVVAVPPRFHLQLTLRALAAGKHVLVEKPAFPRLADYERVRAARARAGRVVLVGENDHYKPLAVCLRRLVAERAVGDIVLASFMTLARRLKATGDWRNDEAMAGGDAFFEEGIHWLHLANSLGPTITTAQGYRPPAARAGPDRRAKSMLVAFRYEHRRRRLAPLLARGAVAAAWTTPVEALRAGRHHHLRVERRLCRRARQGAGKAAVAHSRRPRHPRLPGDVPRLRRCHPRRASPGN